MIVVGAVVWLGIAALYGLLTLGAGVVCAFARQRPGSGRLSPRLLAALVAAMAVSPIGCGALYVPLVVGEEIIKPRLVDSLAVSYSLSFALAFGSVALLLATAERRNIRRR